MYLLSKEFGDLLDGARFSGTECQRRSVMWRTAACCHAVHFGIFMWDPFLLILCMPGSTAEQS